MLSLTPQMADATAQMAMFLSTGNVRPVHPARPTTIKPRDATVSAVLTNSILHMGASAYEGTTKYKADAKYVQATATMTHLPNCVFAPRDYNGTPVKRTA